MLEQKVNAELRGVSAMNNNKQPFQIVSSSHQHSSSVVQVEDMYP